MDLEHLQQLIRIIEQSDLAEIEIEEDGRRVRIRKSNPEAPAQQGPPMAYYAPEQFMYGGRPMPGYPGRPEAQDPGAGPAGATPPEPQQPADEDEGLVTIDSPMVGVFYAAPAPGEPPYTKPGETVHAGDTVCIVEAMKLMNEVTSKSAGEVVKVLVENSEPVEFGQPLFAVRPLESK